MEKILFGSDPEFFVQNEKGIVPPVFLLGEGKDIIWKEDFPYRVYEESKDIKITSDGAAFELVVSPQENFENLFETIQEGISRTKELAENDENKLTIVPSARLPEEYFVKETMLTGCDPDYDALDPEWYAKENMNETPFRFAGAHIHLGFVDKDFRQQVQEKPLPFIQLMGFFLGIPAYLFSDEKELEKLRMKYYGKPAKYRLPKHGIEYRSPSNNWIKNKDLAYTIFENVYKVVELFKNPQKGRKVLENHLDELSFGFSNPDLPVLEEVYNKVQKYV